MKIRRRKFLKALAGTITGAVFALGVASGVPEPALDDPTWKSAVVQDNEPMGSVIQRAHERAMQDLRRPHGILPLG